MGAKTYDNCIKLLKGLKVKKTTIAYLKKQIMIHIGSDTRTFERSLRTMIELELIKEISEGVYKLNV